MHYDDLFPCAVRDLFERSQMTSAPDSIVNALCNDNKPPFLPFVLVFKLRCDTLLSFFHYDFLLIIFYLHHSLLSHQIVEHTTMA